MLSRGLAFLLGVRFDMEPLFYFIQHIDVLLLREDLLRSLWLLHGQPPLYNLYLGIGARLPRGVDFLYYRYSYLAMGAFSASCVWILARDMNIHRAGRIVVTALWILSPVAIIYENFLFYTYPVQALLLASFVCVSTWLRTSRLRWAMAACGMWSVIVLSRTLFHPLWYVAMTGLLVVLSAKRKPAAIMGGAFLLPVLLWCLKNALVFGFFGTGSWLGMSLARGTVMELDPAERVALVESGDLSPASLVQPLAPQRLYEQVLPPRDPWGHPLLDDEVKSDGHTNNNTLVHLEASRLHRDDALYIIRTHPTLYLQTVFNAWQRFFLSGSDWRVYVINGNQPAIKWWDSVYRFVVFGEYALLFGNESPKRAQTCWLLVATWLLSFIVAGRAGWQLQRGTANHATRLQLVLGMTVAYTLIVPNLVEVGENFRFRYLADPLVYVLIATACVSVRSKADNPL